MKHQKDSFGELVRRLRKIDVAVSGVDSWLLETQNNWQIIIMQFRRDFESNGFHINDYSQWGVVLKGEMTLCAPNKQILRRGDIFYIPANTSHRVEIKKGYRDITILDGIRYCNFLRKERR